MAHVICQPCIGTKDTACQAVCPVDCIRDDGRHLVIDPDVCVDCGACVAACPVSAIFPEAHVPGEWASFIATAKPEPKRSPTNLAPAHWVDMNFSS